jgi:hypothetical protein
MSFPRPDAFSEGFVVEFQTNAGATWVGNFAKWSETESSIHTELGDTAVVIAAGGAGYIVDPEKRVVVREIGFDIQQVWFVPELNAIVVSNGLWFEAFDRHHRLWRSRRLSWDGTRNVYRSGTVASGEAYTPIGDDWLPFRIDLATGDVEGGSYNGPD